MSESKQRGSNGPKATGSANVSDNQNKKDPAGNAGTANAKSPAPPAGKPSTPSAAAGAKGSAQAPSPPRSGQSTGAGQSRHGGRGLALLALLVAVVAFGASGYLWHLFDQANQRAASDTRLTAALDQAAQNAAALGALEAALGERVSEQAAAREQGFANLTEKLAAAEKQLSTAQQEATQELVTRIENLQLAQRGLNETLETLRETVASGGDTNAWTLSEVDYLLQIADHRLRFQQDVDSSLAALTLARQRLGAVNEMAFNPVLVLLDEEIAKLKGVDQTDVTAIAGQMTALAEKASALPVRNDMRTEAIKSKALAERKALQEGGAQSVAEGDNWLGAVASKAWGEMKNLVVVRHERREAPPLIAPDEEYFLAENLRLKIEAARLALLLGDGAVYQESLGMAQKWISTYYEPADDNVISVQKEIKALQQVEVNPYLPDISQSKRAFQDVMNHRQPLRPLATEGRSNPTADAAPEGQG